jgi:hypothetical protein
MQAPWPDVSPGCVKDQSRVLGLLVSILLFLGAPEAGSSGSVAGVALAPHASESCRMDEAWWLL